MVMQLKRLQRDLHYLALNQTNNTLQNYFLGLSFIVAAFAALLKKDSYLFFDYINPYWQSKQ